jgi:hypothetical protein
VKGSSADHTALVRAVLLDLGSLPGVIIGANASGRARYMSERTGKSHVVPYGWLAPGSPDILAAIAPLGRLLALECKTGSATLSKDQHAVHAALRAVGVVVEVVRSVQDARAAIARAA